MNYSNNETSFNEINKTCGQNLITAKPKNCYIEKLLWEQKNRHKLDLSVTISYQSIYKNNLPMTRNQDFLSFQRSNIDSKQ